MRVIRSIVFNPDGVDIQYMDDGDVRLNGQVYLTHQLSVAMGGDHDDEINAVQESAHDLLTDVLQDFARSLPFDPRELMEDEDDDDDE